MIKAWWKRFDWWLAGATMALLTAGLLMLASSTLGTHQPYLQNQLIFVGGGIVVSAISIWLGYQLLIEASLVGYGGLLSLLVAVALFAHITRGAASWLSIGPFTLQPSELMKLGILLLLAWLIHQAEQRIWNPWLLFGLMTLALLPPLVLILLQPDLGTAVVLLVAWLVAVWMSPVNKWILLSVLALSLIGGVGGWTMMKPYQRQRVMTFVHPDTNPLGTGYNVLQSQIAVGSGQWFGRGWGQGTQSHLNFLPEHHTDFIFASLSEEFGFVGAIVVVMLYGVIVWRGVNLAWQAPNRATVVLVTGITVVITFQAFVNIAMNIGLAPVTGVPLPLVSYGGSSLLVTLVSLAVLESVALAQG